MPRLGEFVTVRALVNMPGVNAGEVQVLEWTARLAKLVRMGRYELVEPEEPPTEPPPDEPEEPPTEPDGEVTAAVDKPQPAETKRARRR
ncbi:hypothetical protein ACQEVC_34275 [Plantactinospora sp. CA-294935]|uniref:hypothetical protein n=1 Tax=Plantactinospora sp. CA-294935 TaxID=3240012 RepID=UPI003D95099E